MTREEAINILLQAFNEAGDAVDSAPPEQSVRLPLPNWHALSEAVLIAVRVLNGEAY